MTLLSDREMIHFITRGYLILTPELDFRLRDRICRDTRRALAEGNPANDILHKAPDLAEVFSNPIIAGALKSLLGSNYTMYSHRHCHLNRAGNDGRKFHQDGSFRQFKGWSRPWRRHHHPRTVMAIYYPHDVPVTLGPTGIIPGTQYDSKRPDHAMQYELPFLSEGGSVLLVHFDMWHRVSDNTSDRDRIMMKFLFRRTEEPSSPSWNADSAFTPDFNDLDLSPPHPSDALLNHPLIYEHMWAWYNGFSLPTWTESQSPTTAAQAAKDLASSDDLIALNAAYTLARLCAVSPLMEALNSDSESLREHGPFGLAAAGNLAVSGLIDALESPNPWIRATGADTIGDIGIESIGALPQIRMALTDPDPWVRHNAAFALSVWGPSAEAAHSELVRSLQDTEPFVGFNALTALGNMNRLDQDVISSLRTHENSRLRYHATEILNRLQAA